MLYFLLKINNTKKTYKIGLKFKIFSRDIYQIILNLKCKVIFNLDANEACKSKLNDCVEQILI